ncbi:hypothetical protein BH10PLA2_BH10PLA2_26480 [soil metagenome]
MVYAVRLVGLICLMLTATGADWADHPENKWVKHSSTPTAPVPHFGWEGGGDYDPVHRLWIHHAGHDGVPQGFHLFCYDIDTGTWQQRFPNTSPPGACCVDGAHVYDRAHARYVRFPGASLGHGYQWSRGVKLKNSAVWLYDVAANSWTNMRPPPYKPFSPKEGLGYLNGGAVYDPNHELALSFGGQDNAGDTNNLFAYDAYTNALHRLPAATRPSPRDGMGMCYDSKKDCLVLFGSQYNDDEQTWIYRLDSGRWEAHVLNPHPPGKKLGTYSTIPRLAYDSRNGICLGLVWDTNKGTHETWALDVKNLRWTKLNPAVEPDPSMSRSRNLAYSPELNAFLLETSSQAGKGNDPQIWSFRYRTPPADAVPPPPENVELVTAANKITLNWSPGSSSVKEHAIYRARAIEPWKAKFDKIAAVSGQQFEDTSAEPGSDLLYYICAIGNNGLMSRPSVRAHTQPRVSLKPVVSVLAADKVQVNWKAHPAADVVGYNLYRGLVTVRTVKKGTPAPWKDNNPEYDAPIPAEVRDITDIQKLNASAITGTSFSDNQVSLSKNAVKEGDFKYHVFAYIVRAVNRLGVESGPSPYALTIPAEPEHVFNREAGDTASLEWAASLEQGVRGYRIYKLDGVWNINCLTPEPIKTTTFQHAGGKKATRYWITAIDALGQEGQPSSPVWHGRSYAGFFQGDRHQ